MKPCSYFLPKCYLKKVQVDDDDEKKSAVNNCSVPVFSHTFGNVDHFTSDYLYKITMADSGRRIFFSMKKQYELSTSVSFTEYQFSNKTIILAKQTILNIENTYDHRIYDSTTGVCFFFYYLMTDKEHTSIYITYAMVGDKDDGIVRKSLVLKYNQLFTKYSCGYCFKDNMLVVVTGNKVLGGDVKEQVSCMDLLSYQVFTNSRVKIKHKFRRTMTEVNQSINGNEIISLQANYVNIYPTFDGKKLILIFPNKYSIIVYSIGDDTFGPVCNYQQSNIMRVHCFDDYFHVYHKDFGDLLLICNQEGKICVARENNVKMNLLEEKTLSLLDFGYSTETFDYLHVDCFDDILIFVLASGCSELLVISFFQKCVLCRYVPDLWNQPYADIIDVTTNWSGEEVFVFLCRADGKFELDILYLKKKKKLCLKELSKMAVLQTYSVKDLMEMNLPKRLREEMKLL